MKDEPVRPGGLSSCGSSPVAETGWLIEAVGSPVWLKIGLGMVEYWTAESVDALRFCRKDDAESYIAAHFGARSPLLVTEHRWG